MVLYKYQGNRKRENLDVYDGGIRHTMESQGIEEEQALVKENRNSAMFSPGCKFCI